WKRCKEGNCRWVKVFSMRFVLGELKVSHSSIDESLPMSSETRLKELHLELPPPPQPLATYIPAVRAGALLFVSGVLPMQDGQLVFSGKLGRDLTVEQGVEAAKLAILNALAIAKQELGTLDRITRVVKVV